MRATFVRLVLFAAAILGSTPAFGQTLIYGSISGTVTDNAGAVMPGVRITLLNEGTQEQRLAVTDQNGVYRFLNVLPAAYRIEANASGFKRFVQTGVAIEVNKAAQVDIGLEVGAVSESVEVKATVPLIDPQTSSLGQVVDSRKVRDLPLNGRNPLALVALVPSVVPQGGSQRAPAGQNFFAWGNFQIGGGAANQSQAYLDGAPLNLNYANLLALVPTQDSLAEFKVQTNSLSAEFGRTSGGILNLNSRSGTNQLHGTVYEFLRNRELNANTFFNNSAGVGRPPFVQNQFGATLGGPIRKDKLFVMGNWEGYRQRVGRSLVLSVPTAEMRNGDFSDLRDARGAITPVYDPLTICGRLGNPACATNASGAEILTRQQFPGNVIPRNRIDPAGAALSKSWGLPTGDGQPFTHVGNYVSNTSAGANADWLTARMDYNVSERQRIFGRYSLWKSTTLEIDPFGTHAYPSELVQGSPEEFTTQQVMIADTWTITPTLVTDVRVSWLRQRYDRTSTSYGIDLSSFGWPAFMNNEVTTRFLPALSVPGVSSFSANTGSYIRGRTEDRSVGASLTKIAGQHTVKFGGEVRIGPLNYLQLAGGSGNFGFDRNYTASSPLNPVGGAAFASFLLGYPVSGNIPTSRPIAAQQIYRALFVQDDWKVRRRLTLNLGLRWDNPGAWSERYDRMSIFLPDAESPLAAATRLPLRGKYTVVNSADWPSRNNTDPPGTMFGPRVGLAYQARQKTVLRAGYGIFWVPNQVAFNSSPNNDIVNSQTNTMIASLDGGLTPFARLNNPYPNGLIQPAGHDPDFERRLWGLAPGNTVVPNDKPGYVQQWNFNVQQEMPGAVFLDVAYAGSKGTHLPFGNLQLDQLPASALSLGQSLLQQVPNPFFGTPGGTGLLQGATATRGQLLRPYPQFNGLAAAALPVGDSNYHSLQVKLQRRFGSGSLLIAYTYAKLITNGGDSLTGWLETDTGGVPATQDSYNLRAERSVGGFDAPQRFVASYAVDLPFGRGKRFGGSLTGVPQKLASGWGLEGITTFQSGFPLRLTSNPNTSNSLGGGQRPNSNGRNAGLEGAAQSRLNRWFDTSVFSAPPAFTFGNVSRTLGDVRAHGISNWDLGLFKNTPVWGERVVLQFRAEFFNLFNRVQFGFPGQTLGTPQFGVVNNQVNEPRLAQLALRLSF